jgi:hypothetical protein
VRLMNLPPQFGSRLHHLILILKLGNCHASWITRYTMRHDGRDLGWRKSTATMVVQVPHLKTVAEVSPHYSP